MLVLKLNHVSKRATGHHDMMMVADFMVPNSHQAINNHHPDLVTRAWLSHWGRATHICVGDLTITGSDNGLSPGRRQAIIWTNAGKLLIGPLGINFSEILIEILRFSFKKMRLKVSSAKWLPLCLGLNVLWSQCKMNITSNMLIASYSLN